LHDVGLLQDLAAGTHDLGDGLAVAGHLEQLGRDQGRRLGDVELQAAALARPGDLGGHEDEELVALLWGEVHARDSKVSTGEVRRRMLSRRRAASLRQGTVPTGSRNSLPSSQPNARTNQVARTNAAVRGGRPRRGMTSVSGTDSSMPNSGGITDRLQRNSATAARVAL